MAVFRCNSFENSADLTFVQEARGSGCCKGWQVIGAIAELLKYDPQLVGKKVTEVLNISNGRDGINLHPLRILVCRDEQHKPFRRSSVAKKLT